MNAQELLISGVRDAVARLAWLRVVSKKNGGGLLGHRRLPTPSKGVQGNGL
jgi:hypothetical protein